ncbi:hypothetical protein, partial [Flavobacterium filum]|uniref:hypothetical protein n=1 Tax=Flavobacterium filum TaxID=370974 RepID=UPI0023EF8AD1
LRLMIRQSVKEAIDFLDNTDLNPSEKKERLIFTNKFVGVIYNALQNYKIANLSKPLQKQLSHYKLTVITGLIIIKLQPNLIVKFKGAVIDNEQLRPDEIKEPIAPFTKKFVKKYFLKK